MNGRRLFREYAQSKGKEAISFVEVLSEFHSNDTLVTLDSKHAQEYTHLNYKDMVHWIIKCKSLRP